MAFKHGVYASQRETSVSVPVESASGIPFVVGRAPVHTVGGKINEPILCNTYAEAVAALGYSDDWDKYELCEMVYSHFKLFGMSPVIFVNVLNPANHKASAEAADMAVLNGQIALPLEALMEGLVVKSPSGQLTKTVLMANRIGMTSAISLNTANLMVYVDVTKEMACVADTDYTFTYEDGNLTITATTGGKLSNAKSCYVECQRTASETFAVDEDYALFYGTDKLILEIIEGGRIPLKVDLLNVAYTKVNPAAVTAADIIGGYDPIADTYNGLELIDKVYPKFLIVPDLVLCPGWSSDSGVAAAMTAKASNINGLFRAKALIDADCSTVRRYSDVREFKSDNSLSNPDQILFWPMGSLAGKKFHMSVQAAGRMAATDGDNDGCPCESPSNKPLQIDSVVLADGTEVNMDLAQANYLNSIGVVTALNFATGFVLWGNYTSCYPANSDVKDYFIPVSRMFNWVGTKVILTYWSKTDKKLTRRLIDSIVDGVNIWLNGLTAEEKLLGGRCEFLSDENSTVDLMAGILKFHIYLTPPSPAQEIDFILEYDVAYVISSLVG